MPEAQLSQGWVVTKQSKCRCNYRYDALQGCWPQGIFVRLPSGPRAMTTMRCLASAAAVAVALAAASMLMSGRASAQVKWRLPTAYPADNFHSENLKAFPQDLADVTGAKLFIPVHPNPSFFPA